MIVAAASGSSAYSAIEDGSTKRSCPLRSTVNKLWKWLYDQRVERRRSVYEFIAVQALKHLTKKFN